MPADHIERKTTRRKGGPIDPMADRKYYTDKGWCPKGHFFTITRRVQKAGVEVKTWCRRCASFHTHIAGPLPSLRVS